MKFIKFDNKDIIQKINNLLFCSDQLYLPDYCNELEFFIDSLSDKELQSHLIEEWWKLEECNADMLNEGRKNLNTYEKSLIYDALTKMRQILQTYLTR